MLGNRLDAFSCETISQSPMANPHNRFIGIPLTPLTRMSTNKGAELSQMRTTELEVYVKGQPNVAGVIPTERKVFDSGRVNIPNAGMWQILIADYGL